MARIPEREIERLKRDVSLERLAEARGIELRRHGADLIGLCPFHEDHQPSLVITPKKNLWHCLGACRAGGSVIDWVMRSEGVSFRHAVELLRSDLFPSGAGSNAAGLGRTSSSHTAGLSREVARASCPPRGSRASSSNTASLSRAGGAQSEPPKQSTVRKLPPPIVREAGDREVLLQVVNYYHEALKESPEALQYLERRGLESSEMLERFKLGFANRTLGYRLPNKNRQEGAELRGRLQKLGVLRESGHEHFNGPS